MARMKAPLALLAGLILILESHAHSSAESIYKPNVLRVRGASSLEDSGYDVLRRDHRRTLNRLIKRGSPKKQPGSPNRSPAGSNAGSRPPSPPPGLQRSDSGPRPSSRAGSPRGANSGPLSSSPDGSRPGSNAASRQNSPARTPPGSNPGSRASSPARKASAKLDEGSVPSSSRQAADKRQRSPQISPAERERRWIAKGKWTGKDPWEGNPHGMTGKARQAELEAQGMENRPPPINTQSKTGSRKIISPFAAVAREKKQQSPLTSPTSQKRGSPRANPFAGMIGWESPPGSPNRGSPRTNLFGELPPGSPNKGSHRINPFGEHIEWGSPPRLSTSESLSRGNSLSGLKASIHDLAESKPTSPAQGSPVQGSPRSNTGRQITWDDYSWSPEGSGELQ